MLELMNYFKTSGKKKPHSLSKAVDEEETPLPAPVKTAR
jgi:hypothetical protein